jgi:hypothetical protein
LQAAMATANEIQIKMYFFIVEKFSFKKLIKDEWCLKRQGVLSETDKGFDYVR